MNLPENLFYTKEHEWIDYKDGNALIGITDHAQHQLGDIVFVELPEIGKKISKGDIAAVVESVKAVANVYSGIDGEVTETNAKLEDSPELINNSPYDSWIAKIKINDPKELEGLMNFKQYEDFVNKGED